MLKSLVIAFSTYSKLPMPKTEWNERTMRYSMCFFPLVGAVVGAVNIFVMSQLNGLLTDFGVVLPAVVLTVLPLVITGGIHMDGYLDTVDAKSSYRSAEERLKILKDPHTGAFAIIFGAVYLLTYFGFMHEIVRSYIAGFSLKAGFCIALGYVYSRILSGFAAVTLRKAKSDGMLAESAKASDKSVKWILAAELILCMAGFLGIDLACGTATIAAGVICFFYYRHMAYREFGGITGDLAGYFLQITELAILIFVTVVQYK